MIAANTGYMPLLASTAQGCSSYISVTPVGTSYNSWSTMLEYAHYAAEPVHTERTFQKTEHTSRRAALKRESEKWGAAKQVSLDALNPTPEIPANPLKLQQIRRNITRFHNGRLKDTKNVLERYPDIQASFPDTHREIQNTIIVLSIGTTLKLVEEHMPWKLHRVLNPLAIPLKVVDGAHLVSKDPLGDKVAQDLLRTLMNKHLSFARDCYELIDSLGLSIEELIRMTEDLMAKQNTAATAFIKKEPPEILAPFHPKIRAAILKNTNFVELAKGCSVGCPFCGVDPIKGVRDIMPFQDAAWVMMHAAPDFFHFEGDPLDAPYYSELVMLYEALHETIPHTSTAYPVHSLAILRALEDRITRLSLSIVNKKRLERDKLSFSTERGSVIPRDAVMAQSLMLQTLTSFPAFFRNIIRIQDYPTKLESELSRFVNFLIKPMGSKGTFHDRDGRTKLAGRGMPEDRELSSSIACEDVVVIGPHSADNTAQMFATQQNKKGLVRVNITREGLLYGETEIRKMSTNIFAKAPTIEDVLSHGIICHSDRRAHSANVSDSDIDQYEIEPEEFLHTVYIVTYNSEGWPITRWECTYNLVSGEVLELNAQNPSTTYTPKTHVPERFKDKVVIVRRPKEK